MIGGKVKITIPLESEKHKKLKMISIRKNVKLWELVDQIVDEYLKGETNA